MITPCVSARSDPAPAELLNPGCQPATPGLDSHRRAGNLFLLFCRSQSAIAALNDRNQTAFIPGDIVR
jgi:hypothetical protein